MKIGLLTVYYSNYGSYYQAASLAKQLEALGHDCEIVNASIRGKHAINFLLGAAGEHVLPKAITDQVAKRVTAFRTYHAMRPELDALKIGPLVFSAKALAKRYDCVIVGSDELWSATSPVMYFIPSYFGIGVQCPHITYSTSAVTLQNPSAELEAQMQAGVKSFAAISVRDPETQAWVKKWTGSTPPITLDPTLLYPYFGSKGIGGNGIVVYGEHYLPQHVELIRNFAKKQNMKLHALCWQHDWCDDFTEVTSAKDLQNAFAQSDFSMVSTFHGTVFSLLNRRPFAAFAAPGRTEKVTRLLEGLGMQDCFWPETSRDEISFRSSYEVFDKNVTAEREKSLAYLQYALQKAEALKKKD